MGLRHFLGGLFGGRSDAEDDASPSPRVDGTIDVTAKFNHKLDPIERGERYEDPLDEVLREKGYGETDGGGTMTSKEGEIEDIDVHMFLNSPETSIPFVIQFLESRGAPKGSMLFIYEGERDEDESEKERKIPFGVREGFAIYLDGVNLPAEVYKACDSNVVVSEINKRLAGHGEIESHWQGPKETALYIYGDSIAAMKPVIADFMDSYPLCKGARIVNLTP